MTKQQPKNNLREVMEFFGASFSPCNSDPEEIIANECPICGKDNFHCFVNVNTNVYKCHSCSSEGNLHTFLEHIWTERCEAVSHLETLSEIRKLPLDAFMTFNEVEIGYYNDLFWFPTYNTRNRITDIRYYNPISKKRPKSLPSISVGIFGGNQLFFKSKNNLPIYITEGEFDCIAINWLLRQNKIDAICISLPGASTFKKEWAPLFRDRTIVLCMDHDKPGEEGCKRVKRALADYRVNLKRIYWPETFPTRYDLNDFITAYGVKTQNPIICWKTLSKLIKPYDTKTAEVESKLGGIPEHISFDELLEKYYKTLDINENYLSAIKVSLATVLSLQICGDNPIWMFLVGPPGYGKTAILSSLKLVDSCEFQSSLSRHMLISGFRGEGGSDPSVLARMDGRCLILKDYTEILGMSHTDRAETLKTLRGIYDGYAEKQFGNLIFRKYALKMGILAGVTDAIKHFTEAAMGERFLRFSISTEGIDYKKQQHTALMSSFFGTQDKEVLQLYAKRFLEQEWDMSEERIRYYIESFPEFVQRIIDLAKLTAYLRVEVIRHATGAAYREIAFAPRVESGNRLTVQFQRLAMSLAILEEKEELDEDIFQLMRQIAFDTVDKYETSICDSLHLQNGKPICKQEIQEKTGLSPSSASLYLENLCAANLIQKKPIEVGDHKITGYYLNREVKNLWKKVNE